MTRFRRQQPGVSLAAVALMWVIPTLWGLAQPLGPGFGILSILEHDTGGLIVRVDLLACRTRRYPEMVGRPDRPILESLINMCSRTPL